MRGTKGTIKTNQHEKLQRTTNMAQKQEVTQKSRDKHGELMKLEVSFMSGSSPVHELHVR